MSGGSAIALLSPNALRVLEARYLRPAAARRVIETPEEVFLRGARAVAQAELLLGTAHEADDWQEAFHGLLASLDFLPNSPTLMNAGTPLGQLSACFVLPVEDTIEGIFDALRAMALVQRTGGGAGVSASGPAARWGPPPAGRPRAPCRSCGSSTAPRRTSSRAGAGAARTWGCSRRITRTSWSSSRRSSTGGGFRTSTCRWRSPTASWRPKF